MTESEALPPAKQDRRWRLLILGSSLLIFLVASLYGLLHGFSVTQPAWAGYYTLLVDQAFPAGQLDALLDSGGFGDFISAGSNRVVMGGANGLRSESWAMIRGQLGVPDPRFDGYVSGLDQFFSDRDQRWQIAYLPARDGLLSVMLRLERTLGAAGAAWQILEWRPVQGVVLTLAGLVVGALVVGGSRGRRLVMGLSLLPWLPFCLSAGPVFFAFQAASLLLWSLLLESLLPSLKRFSHDVPQAPFFWDHPSDSAWVSASFRQLLPFLDRPSLRVRGLLFLAVQSAYLACVWLRGAPELLSGIAVVHFLAWPALLLLLARMYQLRHRRSEHQLFAPVPMLTTRRVLVTSLRPVLLPLVLVGCLLPLAFAIFQGGGTAAVMVPGGMARGLSYRNALAALADDPGQNGAASLVRHLAFQAALPFRKDLDWRRFELPPAGTAIGLTNHDFVDGALKTSQDVRLVLDDAWLRSALGRLPARSIDRLLVGQGRISGLVFATQGKVYSADVWIIPALAGLILLVLPFWLAGREPGFRQLYGSSRISTMGRKVAA